MIGKGDIRHRGTSLRATADGKNDTSLAWRDDGSRKSVLHVVESSSVGQLDAKVFG